METEPGGYTNSDDVTEWFYCSDCEKVFSASDGHRDEMCSHLLFIISETELRTALAAIEAAKKEV